MHWPSTMSAIQPQITRALATILLLLSISIATTPAFAASTADLEIVSVAINKPELVPGETVTYTITYRNNGPDTVPDAVVSDAIPSEISGLSFTSSPPVSAISGPPGYAFQLGSLASGETGTITIEGTVAVTAVNGAIINNTASITAPDLTDATPGNNSKAAAFTVVEPVLTVDKTINTATTGVDAGDSVRYQIRIDHAGSSTASAYALSVTDDLPAGIPNFFIVSALVTDGVNSRNVAGLLALNGSNDLVTTGQIDLLQNTSGTTDETLTIILQGTVRDAIQPGSTIANAATATWRNGAGTQEASYTATGVASTIIVPQIFSVAKSTNPVVTEVNSGDIATYQLATTLIEGTTQNLQWTDTLPAGMSYVPGSIVVSDSNGLAVNGLNASGAGQILTISASSVTNPGNVNNAAAADSDTFLITYQTVIDPNVAHGAVLTNSVNASADPGLTDNNNTVSVTVRNIPPQTGTLTAPNITQAQAGQTSSQISLVLIGDVAIDVSTLDTSDLSISGPQGVTLSSVSVNPAGNGTPRTATYTITPPGGSWDDSDNGTYTVSIVSGQVFDIYGRSVAAAALGPFTVTMDTTAPTTQVDSGPPTLTDSTGATFTFSGTDETTPAASLSFECKLDTGTFTACTSPQSYTNLADGDHTFEVRGADAVNNQDASPAIYNWTVASTPPQSGALTAPDITQAQAGQTSSSISLEFIGSAPIDVSTIDIGNLTISGPQTLALSAVSVNPAGNGTLRTATYTITPPGGSWDDSDNGTYTISLLTNQVFDMLGRPVPAMTLGTFSVTMDTTAPTTQIDDGPPALTNSTTASFTFSGADETTPTASLSFQCKLDTGAFTACTSPQSYTNLSDGNHTFEVRTLDAVGNQDASPASYSWVVDLAAPTVTIDQAAGQNDPALSAPILFTATFSKPVTGFDDTDVTIGGTAGATSSVVSGSGAVYTIAVSGMTDEGTVSVSIGAGAAQDSAGNNSATSSAIDDTVTFAPIVPVVTGIVRNEASPTRTAVVSFTITFIRPVNGVDLADFVLETSGISGAALTGITGSGASYIVTVSTGTGSGMLALKLVDDDTIADLLGRALGGTGDGNGDFDGGEVYQIDRTPPAASLNAPKLSVAAGIVYTFTVVYSDNLAIDRSSIGAGDIRVRGPKSFDVFATLVEVTPAGNGSPRTAIYQITAPGGAWEYTDNGIYVVSLVVGEVMDEAGNAAAAGTLGAFEVKLAPASQIFLPIVVGPSSVAPARATIDADHRL